MGAPSQYYVDPSINTDTGAGTVGDPWGAASGSKVQRALNLITRDATNGDQINVIGGTPDVLAAELSLATYGAPSGTSAPLTIRGCTATANDGGRAEIDCNGNNLCNWTSGNGSSGVNFIDLEIHNGHPTNTSIIRLGTISSVQRCKLHNSNGGIYFANFDCSVFECEITDMKVFGIHFAQAYCIAEGNWVADGATNQFSDYAIKYNNFSTLVFRNIIQVSGSANGVEDGSFDDPCYVCGNSIISAGGSGSGIELNANSAQSLVIHNNLIEGFTTGTGINLNSATEVASRVSHNGVFNCGTDYSLGDALFTEDNESLGSSPFAKSGDNTFANRFTYFAPNDVGNVLSGFPSGSNFAKGAVQPAAGGGGSSVFVIED